MEEEQNIKKISDYNEIFKITWDKLDIKPGQKVLDIGVGRKALSSKSMLDMKLKVVGIDVDPECGILIDELGFPVVTCDAYSLPFVDDSFDFSLAFFSLHEMDPKKHIDILSEMKRVSKKLVIIEPLPNTHRIGKLYDKIWQDAMNSVGKFEIDQPLEYWVSLISELKPKKIFQCRCRLLKKVPKEEAEDFCKQSIDHFKRDGVGNKYIDKMRDLAQKIKIHGMEHSDIIVIIGFFD